MINLEELKQFLLEADKPHAFGTAEVKAETDGSRSIVYEQGDWRMHDNFYGGEPYGGRQVIFYKCQPVWLCVYYGRVLGDNAVAWLYSFLREALQHPEDEIYRGPSSYKKGDLEYKNQASGNMENFSGREVILKDNQEIYEASYIGGLVDQRAKGSL
jgi:hypothetical protein